MSALSLEQALAALPNSADRIAAYLAERGHKGRPQAPGACPIAAYLIAHGLTEPIVSWTGISAVVPGLRPKRRRVEPVRAVAEFIEWFDAVGYPHLVEVPGA